MLRAVPWTLEARSADGRYLLIEVPSDECSKVSRIYVLEANRSVTMAPIAVTPALGAACVANLAVQKWAVDLGASLGQRRLLHLVQG